MQIINADGYLFEKRSWRMHANAFENREQLLEFRSGIKLTCSEKFAVYEVY